MLTAAMVHELEVRGLADDRIDRAELRQRAQMREQAAAHLQDLKKRIPAKASIIAAGR
jgi:hypothetical protein